MMTLKTACAAAALSLALPLATMSPAGATPAGLAGGSAPLLAQTIDSDVTTVQFRGRGGGGFRGGGFRGGFRGGGYRGGFGRRGFGGVGIGLGTGLLLGGALAASPYYYGSGYPGYYGGYGYGGPVVVDEGYADDSVVEGNDVASCSQRFKSYNPATGTYLGYDGLRHPCP